MLAAEQSIGGLKMAKEIEYYRTATGRYLFPESEVRRILKARKQKCTFFNHHFLMGCGSK